MIEFCVLWHTREEALLDFCHKNKAKCCQISSMKIRRNATIPNTFGKHRSRPHPFQIQTSKPNSLKAPKANANSLFSTANVLKLWFYQNKGLSMDRHFGVPNTFPTHDQASKLKNQDILPIHIRLGKMPFFLSLGSIIKSKSRVTNHTLKKPNDWW